MAPKKPATASGGAATTATCGAQEDEAEDEREVARPLLGQQNQQSLTSIGVGRMWDADRDDQERNREREYPVAEGPHARQARILSAPNLEIEPFIKGRRFG